MRASLLLSALIIALLGGCRGWTSDKPPVHPNPNMDTQVKYKPYRQSSFFEDERDMRPALEGVVPRGTLKEDDWLYRGLQNGALAQQFPPQIKINAATLARGQDRFNIYCAPCHSQVGDGNGMVGRRMLVKATNLHSEYLYNQPIGHFFDVITNGIRTMPSYKDKLISEEDRWYVVAYIKALQMSQDANGSWINKKSLGLN